MGTPERLRGMARRESSREHPVLELIDAAVEPRDDAIAGPGVVPVDEVESFETFYERELPRLLALAHALAGPAQAADVAQESMLVAYVKWDEVSTYGSPAAWVRGVCSHKAVSFVRRRVIEGRVLARLRARSSPPRAEDALADEDFWNAVRSLPPRQAQAAALYYALDLGLADIAATLGCAEGTVKVHLSRARTALTAHFRTYDQEDRS